jgi:hypothetical protein
MRSRNRHRAPRLAPIKRGAEDCPRPQTPHQRQLTRTPWQNHDGWWKLTMAGRLYWAPLNARRWRWTPWFVQDDHLCHSCSSTCAEEIDSVLELFAEGRQLQVNERLDRRAIDARRRRALKPPHPPKQCACCGQSFTPKRTDAKCCSAKCRAKLSRQRAAVAA